MQWHKNNSQRGDLSPEEELLRPGRGLMQSAQTLGILGILCDLLGSGLLGIIMGAAGIGFSCLAKRKGYGKVSLILYIVLSVIAIVWGVVLLIMDQVGAAV